MSETKFHKDFYFKIVFEEINEQNKTLRYIFWKFKELEMPVLLKIIYILTKPIIISTGNFSKS